MQRRAKVRETQMDRDENAPDDKTRREEAVDETRNIGGKMNDKRRTNVGDNSSSSKGGNANGSAYLRSVDVKRRQRNGERNSYRKRCSR